MAGQKISPDVLRKEADTMTNAIDQQTREMQLLVGDIEGSRAYFQGHAATAFNEVAQNVSAVHKDLTNRGQAAASTLDHFAKLSDTTGDSSAAEIRNVSPTA